MDLIIGNHPHVIQPIEWIDHTLVVYSLGNFISGQKGTNKRIGILASVKVEKKTWSIKLHKPRADLIYTYYDENMKNFVVYPFSKLNNTLLPNYKSIYKEYLNIIKSKSIHIGL
ncbi:putative capsule biosynthesis protein [Helicobacter fennelliae]|uniref:Putative capsule biosynthesis protein n=1 Tax=Helicobacter fennelliae TaxID=215 RepID=A0A2X3ELV5_9HELI|nr:putative capsule biosynthesis protein [Helicobacter fennelliae]